LTQDNFYHWWRREDLCYHQGQLCFAGWPVPTLATRFATPSFVYSAARVRANLERLHAALDNAGLAGRHAIHYAMKANRFAPLLTSLKQTGLCGIDACSPAEVEWAVSCGFRPEEISFTASSLSSADLDVLARYDGLPMTCDSLHALRSWGARKPGSTIGIRVNPGLGIGRAANERLHYAGAATTKFGIYAEQFDQALDLARSHGLRVGKIHFHTGCGYLTPQLAQLEHILVRCLEFVERAGATRVNIGGGLGVPHLADDAPLDLEQWAAVLARHLGGRGISVEVEPGEYLVKDAGLLLLGITFVERKQDTLFVGTDAGFNIAPEPAHYNLPFQPLPLVWNGEPCRQATVVGNINEALDVWYAGAWLPDLEGHRFLALINAGAYSAAMASNHCLRGAYKEFLLF
jgi:diaminopimelate decarboxylase